MPLSHPSSNLIGRDDAARGLACAATASCKDTGLREPKLWRPKRVLVTPAALEFAHGRAIVERSAMLGAEVIRLKAN
jgi:hypothetical protein